MAEAQPTTPYQIFHKSIHHLKGFAKFCVRRFLEQRKAAIYLYFFIIFSFFHRRQMETNIQTNGLQNKFKVKHTRPYKINSLICSLSFQFLLRADGILLHILRIFCKYENQLPEMKYRARRKNYGKKILN